MQDTSVLVVGAGPTGLALACDLRARGVDAQVLDRFVEPVATTRALGLTPRGRQILERLGALGDLATAAVRPHRLDVFVDGELATTIDEECLRGPDDDGPLRAPQALIEGRLRERLFELGVTVLWDHEVVLARQDHAGVMVTVETRRGPRSLRAKWLVGCDGSHSVVRDAIGASFDGSPLPGTYLLGDVRLDWDRAPGSILYLKGRDVLTMASIRDDVWRIGVALPAGDPLAQEAREVMTAERDRSSVSTNAGLCRLQELFALYTGDRKTRLSHPTWLSVFRLNRRMSSSFRGSRILIAGDAAHLTSPLGGQGMNAGLADAFNLGWKLAMVIQGKADPRLLDTYESERRPATARIEQATTQWTHLLLGDSWQSRALRRYVVLPAMRSRIAQGWVLSRQAARRPSYRGGPLAPEGSVLRGGHLAHRGPQPGDLGPDAPCVRRKDWARTSVGREIGAHWGLLFFGGDELAVHACVAAARARLEDNVRVLHVASGTHWSKREDVVMDDRGAVARTYRPGKTTAVMLRPDGHVAWRGRAPDAASLAAWLDRTLEISPPVPAASVGPEPDEPDRGDGSRPSLDAF